MYKGPAVIVFADLIGSSELSEFAGLEEYARIIQGFHATAGEIARAVWAETSCNVTDAAFKDKLGMSARGDEFCVIAARLSEQYNEFHTNLHMSPEYGQWIMCKVLAALKFALTLKAAWLVSPYNISERILRGRLPLDMAVGVHIGSVALPKPKAEAEVDVSDFIGYAVNVAKRIEGTGRKAGWTAVMVSPEVRYVAKDALPSIVFYTHPEVHLQGTLRPLQVAEIQQVVNFADCLPQTWRAQLPEDVSPGQLVDALGAVVDCHEWIRGFRFLATFALALSGLDQNAVALGEGLLDNVVKAAMEHYANGEVWKARGMLENIYGEVQGHPVVEHLLADCARVAGELEDEKRHRARIASRRTPYYYGGAWTKGIK